MKKLFLFIFCGLLFAASCTKKEPEPPTIASGTTGELTWKLLDNGTLTISGKGTMPDYYLPNSVPWHEYRDKIAGAIIGDGVSKICNFAFWNCNGLKSANIPNSVKSIEDAAFLGCSSLTSVTIPNSVTAIGNFAFYRSSSLTSIAIPNSVTSIGEYAF